MRTVFIALVIAGLGMPAFAHPGGLNAEECHNDRRNGGYHCHRGPSRSSNSPPPRAQGFVGNGVGMGAATRYYPNCRAAGAAGAALIRRGEPGYGSHLDRDGDGVACEN